MLIGTEYTGVDEDALVDCGEDEIISIVTQYGYITESDNTKPDSKIFGALSSETDTRGYTTKYFYDNTNGNLLAQINVEYGRGYVYEYNDWGALEGVRPAAGNVTSYSGVTTAENVSYEYDINTNRLSKIITDSTEYSFSYDIFGNSAGVTAGDNTLATYEYYPHNGKLKKINYGNGFSEIYSYDNLELLSQVCYNYDDGTRANAYSYTYNPDGTLDELTDYLGGKKTKYVYDSRGRLISVKEKAIGDNDFSYYDIYRVNYDSENRLSYQTNVITYSSTTSSVANLLTTTYTYNTKGNLITETLIHLSDNHKINYNYDVLNRLSSVDVNFGSFDYTTEYSYLDSQHYGMESNSSYLVGSYTSTVGLNTTTYNYGYDTRENITVIESGDSEIVYYYDDIGQLVQESDGTTIRTYTYDNAGNIVSIESKPVSSSGGIIRIALPLPSIGTTATLSYTDSEWGDLLTSFKGTTITYDEIGNPLSYYNGSTYTFTWTGRQLTSAVKGSKTMSFTYNDEGIRTSKTVNGVNYTYQLNGSQIASESWGDKLIVYLYDASGSPIGMMYRTTSYAINQWDVFYFEKNLQGDVVAVYNSAGTKVITYEYTDAWGNHTVVYSNSGASTGAAYNPFRYRGYYYDIDLVMYYLQSRYYDAKICRFISPDSTAVLTATPMALTDKNLYAYCDNNPVMRVDEDGEFWNYVIGGVVGALVGGVAAALDGGDITDIVIGSLAGAASGLVAATGWGLIAQAGASAGIGAVADIANQTFDILNSEGSIADYNIGQTVTETLFGFATSAAGSGLGFFAGKYITGTSALADAAFNSYLEKTFSAGLRKAIGRSSSALLRQAGKFFSQTVFWDNVTRGVSSVVGSILVSGPTIPLKDLVLELIRP